MKKYFSFVILLVIACTPVSAQNFKDQIAAKASAILPEMIQWRRYLHEHPELSNREFKTAEYITAH